MAYVSSLGATSREHEESGAAPTSTSTTGGGGYYNAPTTCPPPGRWVTRNNIRSCVIDSSDPSLAAYQRSERTIAESMPLGPGTTSGGFNPLLLVIPAGLLLVLLLSKKKGSPTADQGITAP